MKKNTASQLDIGTDLAESTSPNFSWPCWWGGYRDHSSVPPTIGADIKALRRAVGGLEARKGGGSPFPVKSAKELMEKLQPSLDRLDMVAFVADQEVTVINVKDIPPNEKGKVVRSAVHVRSTVRVGAADGSFVDFVGSGGGADGDDKAGGKASTYAWKDTVIKGLSVPEQDMIDTDDESDVGIPLPPRPEVVLAYRASLEGATEGTLASVLDAIRADLTHEEQLELSPAYLAARKRLGLK